MFKIAFFAGFFILWQFIFAGVNVPYAPKQDINLCFANTFEEILKHWKLKNIVGQDKYKVIKRQNGNVLHILSNKSASVLFKKFEFDVYDYPHLNWSWKVNTFPKISDPDKEKDIDDYAARVCIIFPSWNIWMSKLIVYVWDDRVNAENEIKPSSFSKNCKIIVVQCGSNNKEKWVTQRRNILDDYKMVFGKKPPKNAGGIGIMSDSDDTKTSTDACYFNIYLKYKS